MPAVDAIDECQRERLFDDGRDRKSSTWGDDDLQARQLTRVSPFRKTTSEAHRFLSIGSKTCQGIRSGRTSDVGSPLSPFKARRGVAEKAETEPRVNAI